MQRSKRMTWQKFKLRVRAILARLNLWSAWPLLVGLAIFGAVYFPNTPGHKDVRESSIDSNDPFANLQRLITEDVKTDFTN